MRWYGLRINYWIGLSHCIRSSRPQFRPHDEKNLRKYGLFFREKCYLSLFDTGKFHPSPAFRKEQPTKSRDLNLCEVINHISSLINDHASLVSVGGERA
ncbi:hypothetical protein V6Z93_010712 [Aspergillus fumigatus]